MAYIITQVDRTTGNYQDAFLYTLNASFNGIEGTISSAQIQFFVPDFCTIYLGDLEYPVQEVRTQALEGGTQYIIDFGALKDTGVAVRIGFGIVFGFAAENGTSYILAPTFWMNGTVVEETQAEAITLSVVPRFTIRKEVVLPTADPAAGGMVYYLVTLQNEGDLGARIEAIAIEALAADGLTIDPTFAVIGKDVSTTGFADTSMDGVQGEIEDNILYFNLSQYRGETYTFLYRAQLAETLSIGQTLETALEWRVDAQPQVGEVHTLTLAEPTEDISLSMYGPDYALPEGKLAYEWRIANTGNQVLSGANCTVTLSQDVQYTEFRTGTFQMRALDALVTEGYQITYTTAEGESGLLGSYNAGTNQTVDLTQIIAQEDNLRSLTWEFPQLRIGVSQKTAPRIKGVVQGGASMGDVLQSETQCSWEIGVSQAQGQTAQRSVSKETEIQDISILQPGFSSSVGETPVRPGDVFRYTVTASAYRSHLNQPILAVLLPAALVYAGGESFSMSNVFGESAPALPPVQQIDNFNAAGDTLLKYAFTGEYAYDFSQMARLTIGFDVQVKIGAKGSFETVALLNVLSGAGEVVSGGTAYTDADDIAQGAVINGNYAKSKVIANQILFFVAASTQKRVRGLLDDDFAAVGGVGQTLSGGAISYEITVRNIGNADLQTVEIIDILPYLGDTGVVDSKTARKSEFFVSLTGEAAAKVVEEGSGTALLEVPLRISYSASTDPVRFGGSFDTIGTVDDWNETAPENMLAVQAVKVGAVQALLPGQSLVIALSALAPVGVLPEATAWNSFASQVTYDDVTGVRQAMLATEARKAGVQVLALPADKGEISGCAWFDENRNGLFEEQAQELEDVGIVLYDATGTPLQVAFTSKTLDGRLGCYAFGNLAFGRYYLRFFIDDNIYQFTRQRLVEGGSIAHAGTGVSVAIDVSENSRFKIANVGLIPKDKYKLEDILMVNRSARSVMRNVIYNQMLIGMKEEQLMDLIK
ncbi:MAG: SdrD B-like domain-containing protein [Faecalibacterium sp.]